MTAFLTDFKKVQEGFSKVPLVEGRSVVSEALCPDFIKAYHSIQSKGFDWYKSYYEYSQIGHISTFVLNCKKRKAYEEELRLEQGLDQNQPVCIPSPGVPFDQPYNENLRKDGYSEWGYDSFSDVAQDQPDSMNKMEDYVPGEEIIDNEEKPQKWNSLIQAPPPNQKTLKERVGGRQ